MNTATLLRNAGVGVVALLSTVVNANAQSSLPYARTEFIPGLLEQPWQWSASAFALNQTLNLGSSYKISNQSTSAVISVQRDQLLDSPDWAITGDKVVLVGHSMGGLVARATAQARPNQVFGIVTVATPISGARIAESQRLGQIKARILDCLNRLNDLNITPNWPFNIRSVVVQVNQSFDNLLPQSTPAIGDLQRNSTAVQSINLGAGPNIPVAQVIGSVPAKDVHLRLAASSGYATRTLPEMVTIQNQFRITARIIKYWGYASLTGGLYARKIGYAINTYEKLDRTIFEQATGVPLPPLLIPPSWPTFDGIVAADDAVWKGWGDVRQVHTVQGEDHISVQTSSNGRLNQQLALEAIGVLRR